MNRIGIVVYTWRMSKEESNRIIDAMGGTVQVARLFSVTKGAVSQWRENGIPDARLMYLRLAYPHVFDTANSNQQQAA